MIDLIGAQVTNKKYGSGHVTEVDDSTISVAFESKVTSFKYPDAFVKGFLIASDKELNEMLITKGEAAEQVRAKHIAARNKELQSQIIASRCNKKGFKVPSGSKYWIKFNGLTDNDQPHQLFKVPCRGKQLYILAYPKKPDVKDDDVVIIAPKIQSKSGSTNTVIVGKGVLEKVTYENEVKKEWIKNIPELADYPWYASLKEVELIKAPACNGIMLKDVIHSLGANTYASYEGQSLTEEELMKKHSRKQHMHLTRDAYNYISEKLDSLFVQYGSMYWRQQ